MKIILKFLISCLAIMGIFMILIKIEQYNFVSFISGMIWMGLYLVLSEYLDD